MAIETIDVNYIREKLLLCHSILTAGRVASNVFLSTYLLKISADMRLVAAYYVVFFAVSTIAFVFGGRFLKSGGQMCLYRYSFLLQLLFFAAVATLEKSTVNYAIPLAITFGLATGAYWLPYNMFKLDLMSSEKRIYFFAYEKACEVLVSSALPIGIGFLIWRTSSHRIPFAAITVMYLFAFILSKSMNGTPVRTDTYNLIAAWDLWQRHSDGRKMAWCTVLFGFSAAGAFELACVLLIYLTVSNEMQLGSIIWLLPLLGFSSSIFVSRNLRPDHKMRWMAGAALLMVISAAATLAKVNEITATVLYSTFAIASPVLVICHGAASFDLIELSDRNGKYRIELMVWREVLLNAGRIASYGCLWSIAQIGTSESLRLCVAISVLACIAMAQLIRPL